MTSDSSHFFISQFLVLSGQLFWPGLLWLASAGLTEAFGVSREVGCSRLLHGDCGWGRWEVWGEGKSPCGLSSFSRQPGTVHIVAGIPRAAKRVSSLLASRLLTVPLTKK